MRSAYGLNTIGDSWESRAGCRADLGVDPDLFFPDQHEAAVKGGQALHVCLSHCPVRAQCDQDAVDNPPDDPQVRGGRRWVASKRPGVKTQPERWLTPARSVGCVLCPPGPAAPDPTPPAAPVRRVKPSRTPKSEDGRYPCPECGRRIKMRDGGLAWHYDGDYSGGTCMGTGWEPR